jgi:hypothetical protein
MYSGPIMTRTQSQLGVMVASLVDHRQELPGLGMLLLDGIGLRFVRSGFILPYQDFPLSLSLSDGRGWNAANTVTLHDPPIILDWSKIGPSNRPLPRNKTLVTFLLGALDRRLARGISHLKRGS